MQAELNAAVEKQRQLSQQAAEAAMQAAAAARRIINSSAEAAAQAAINKQLMERKSEMEWQLMAVLAEHEVMQWLHPVCVWKKCT